jgi:hypothetical protein
MDRSIARKRTLPMRAVLCLTMVSLVFAGAVALRRPVDQTLVVGPVAGLAETASTVAPAVALVPEDDRTIDSVELAAALDDAGVELPEGSSVYAARIVETAGALAYEEFEAGDGARDDDLWPASSVKLLAAEGALAYLAELGFSGAATVTMAGETFTVADVYDAAISESSNEAYDTLVRIAGVDWLNTSFLTEENGFPTTVIQRSYTGLGVNSSPAMTISEDGRRVTVPARRSTGTYDCPEDGNCSNLLEMTESVRRVTLDAQLKSDEQLALSDADVAGLQVALLDAEGFLEPAVEDVLGAGVEVYNKPGYVPGDACVDVALVRDALTSEQYLIGVATPEDGYTCPALVEVAAATLEFLQSTV